MIKICNTYIPNCETFLKVNAIIQRAETQFELTLQFQPPEMDGRMSTFQASVKFEEGKNPGPFFAG